MAIAGPRLDRPSAIGDEGRPRAASATIAALVVLLLLAATAYRSGQLRLVPLLGLATGLTVAGVALLDRHRFPHLLAGHLFVHVAGTGLFLLLLGVVVLPHGVVFGGFAVAMLGIAVTWANVGRAAVLRNALFQLGASYAGLFATFVGAFVLGGAVFGGWGVLDGLLAEAAPGRSLAAFLGVVGVAGVLAALTIRGVPLPALTRRDRRPAVERRLGRARRLLGRGGLLALVAAVLVTIAGGFGLFAVLEGVPLAATLLPVLSSPVVLGPIVAGTVLVIVAGTLGGTTRWLFRRAENRWRRLAAATAGVLLGSLVFLSAAAPGGGPTVEGLQLATLGIAGPIEVAVLLGVLWFLVGTDIVPERALGPALAGAGLAIATVGLALDGFAAPLVFASAAGAVLVWDVSTFGLGLTVELGHRPDTRRLELYHAARSLAVAAGAVVALVGLDALRGAVGSGVGAAPAVALAGLGVAALLLALS